MDFAYHMYGAAMGSLSVDVSTDAGTTWTLNVWTISGNQSNAWKTTSVDLAAYDGQTITIRLRGTTGTNYTSDICIDGLSVQAGGGTTPPVVVSYCQPVPTNGTADGDYINGVSLGTISNLNSGGGAAYRDYTTLSTNIARQSSLTLNVYEGNYAPDRYAAWIDYNQDGDFSDAGEKLGEFVGNSVGSVHQINFTVPSTAVLGTTRLRVRCLYNNNANGVDPCIDGDYGETEDYSVNVLSSSKSSSKSMELNAVTFNVYPNPTSGSVTIVFETIEEENTQVIIYDLMGGVVYRNEARAKGVVSNQVDLSDLAKGVYQVVVLVGDQRMIERVILK